LYSQLRQTIRTEHLWLERRRLLAELAVAVFATAVFIAVAAYLISLSLAGALTIGQVVLFILLLRRAEGAGNEVVSGLSRLVDDHLYLGRLFDFLDTTETITVRAAPAHAQTAPEPGSLQDGVRLENVSFVYPGAPRPAVKDITLHLPPGKIIALVGENGSGKTTLIKLLTRLYDPTSGRVTLNGQDIRELDPVAYRSLFSVIFQDFAMYPETARDNIRFGDVARADGADRAVAAAQEAGANAFIERLPQHYDTPLTKLFDDGHDLSLGQWQRVALARAFFPSSRFIIMDEPTSAVDPAAEFELFDNFRERLAGRAALVISHRLSTVRQADYTYVLSAGEIVEHGTHESLIARDGVYARLFDQQGRHYRV
jgi:ATP-binding cassette subfamily B protein